MNSIRRNRLLRMTVVQPSRARFVRYTRLSRFDSIARQGYADVP